MESFLLATGTIFIFFLSAYGWGGLATKFIYSNPTHSAAYDVSVGLAIWVFIGGLLNALGLAYTIALDIIVVLGILLFVVLVVKLRHEKKSIKQRLPQGSISIPNETRIGIILMDAIPLVILIASVSLLINTILPADAFNYHDDFYKYFPRLFRMLQSGELGGTPFDYVGIDSLGAHAFLQSFVAAHFPLKYINGFDAVFCFLLGGMLLNDIGRRAGLPWFLRSSAIVAFIFINPQYVNISALYSGSLMILSLMYSSLLFYDCIENTELKEMYWAAIPFALIISTLVALKITIAPFAILYSTLFFLLLGLFTRFRKYFLQIGNITAVITAILLVPWLWSVYEKIVYLYHNIITKISHENISHTQPDISTSVISDLFSAKKLFYGGNASDYSFLVLCTLAAAFWAGYLLIKKKELANKGNLIVVTAIGISVVIAYLINGYSAKAFNVGIRYSCPIIIAAFPAIILLFEVKSEAGQAVSGSHKLRAHTFSVLLILGVSIGLFMNGWFGRQNNLFEFRSMLSYPIHNRYVDYNKYTLSEDARERVKTMQNETEEKSTILAWFEHPFLLDFKRNRVFTIGGPTMVMYMGNFTKNDLQDPDVLSIYFRNIGVRYVIWGFNEAKKNVKYKGTTELEKGLEAIMKKSQILYDDGRRVMIDIDG